MTADINDIDVSNMYLVGASDIQYIYPEPSVTAESILKNVLFILL